MDARVGRFVRRGATAAVMLAVVGHALVIDPAAQVVQAVTRSASLKTASFQSPTHHFTLEYPRDWRMVPGGLASLVAFDQRRSEATVVVEYERRELPTVASDVTDLWVQLEQDYIRDRHPGAKGFTAQIVMAGERAIVVIDFTRQGAAGAEQVREYAVPVDRHLYRIVCLAAPPLFAKYAPMFAHIAASFTAAPPPA
jgi:hypothetical protein